MASTNPSNFANLPKDELKEIAAKGGHASHGAHHEFKSSDHPDRNPDGTFTKGSELAKELGAQGGHAAHHDTTGGASNDSGVSLLNNSYHMSQSANWKSPAQSRWHFQGRQPASSRPRCQRRPCFPRARPAG